MLKSLSIFHPPDLSIIKKEEIIGLTDLCDSATLLTVVMMFADPAFALFVVFEDFFFPRFFDSAFAVAPAFNQDRCFHAQNRKQRSIFDHCFRLLCVDVGFSTISKAPPTRFILRFAFNYRKKGRENVFSQSRLKP
jgi:hypothetical protein